MSDDIVKRLRGSIAMDAVNGDTFERKVCDRQMQEAAAEIERLRGENAECRRLLREACDKRYLDDEGQECAYVTSRWLAAAKAGGSDE